MARVRYVDFWPKVFLILYTSLGNLTTHITIANNAVGESGAIIMDFSHFTFAETSDKQDGDDANVEQPSAKNQQPSVSAYSFNLSGASRFTKAVEGLHRYNIIAAFYKITRLPIDFYMV